MELVTRARYERNAPIVDVEPDIPPVEVVHTMAAAQISVLAGNRTAADNAGFTRARLGMRLRFSHEVGDAVADGQVPIWLTRVHVRPFYRSIRVYIAREYPVGSCEYRVTRAHEMEHVRVDEELLREYAGRMRAGLVFSSIPTTDNPILVDNEAAGEEQLEAQLVGILGPIYQRMRVALHRANAELDTPANYAQVHTQCRNW